MKMPRLIMRPFIRVTVLRITNATSITRSPQTARLRQTPETGRDATRGAALAEVPTDHSQQSHHTPQHM